MRRSTSATASLSRVSISVVDGVAVGVWAEALQEVDDQPEEHVRVGQEELRLVVVAHQRQTTLEHAPLIDVGDLGREVVALDAVRVVQEVERVVDGQAEPGAPGDQPLVHLGWMRTSATWSNTSGLTVSSPTSVVPARAPSITWSDRSSVNTSESNRGAGDDVGEQVLDVVEHARFRDGIGQVEDLLLEQELFFVVEHRGRS